MFTAVCDYLFIDMIATEIGRPFANPAMVFEDNQPIVTLLTREAALPKASKHFLMLINYVREQVHEGKLDIRKIPTEENFADIETKFVYGKDLAYKSQHLLGIQDGEVELQPHVVKK